MIFTEPVPFSEALASWRVREIWPTPLSTAEIERLELGFRRASVFSAKVMNAEFLQEVARVTDKILQGKMGTAEAKALLRDQVRFGDPEELMTDSRLELIINTNTEMARGFGQWKQDQDEDLLYLFPAQELIRVATRMEPRNWRSRWSASGGTFYGGRMIAKKNAPIWTAISRFGTPWPPFDFNSGMGLADVDREEAVSLGVLDDQDAGPAPQDDHFDEVPPSASVDGLDPEFREALLASGLGRIDASGRLVATPLDELFSGGAE